MAIRRPQTRDVISFASVFGLLGAVYLLPPDTALNQVRATGTLRVCLPPIYPPLVTNDAKAPGIDIELLQLIARKLGVGLVTVFNPSMGKDFNPRSWRVTRAQCEILAGGVVGSPATRSFLDTTQAYAATGWAWISPHADGMVIGGRVGVLVGVSGLDRIALSTQLRAAKAQVTITLDPMELVQGIRQGRFDIGITEHLLAIHIATEQEWKHGWMPPDLDRYPIVFGLWKGDLTLKRAVVAALDQARESGELEKILDRYIQSGSALEESTVNNQSGRTK